MAEEERSALEAPVPAGEPASAPLPEGAEILANLLRMDPHDIRGVMVVVHRAGGGYQFLWSAHTTPLVTLAAMKQIASVRVDEEFRRSLFAQQAQRTPAPGMAAPSRNPSRLPPATAAIARGTIAASRAKRTKNQKKRAKR